MARKEWYSLRTLEPKGPTTSANGEFNIGHYGGYQIQKLDEDFMSTGHYDITRDKTDGPLHCSCFAGLASKYCRHKQMVPIFEAAGNIDTPALYNFDRKKWYTPPET